MSVRSRLKGILMCFLWTFFIHWEYPLVIAILIILHFTLGWSLWWIAVVIGVWLIFALVRSLILSAANRIGNEPKPYRKNKNPYSKNNSDIFKE